MSYCCSHSATRLSDLCLPVGQDLLSVLLLESERFRQTDLLLGVERDRKEGPTADSPTLLLSLISSQEEGAGGCHLVLRGRRDLQEAPAPLRAVARWA